MHPCTLNKDVCCGNYGTGFRGFLPFYYFTHITNSKCKALSNAYLRESLTFFLPNRGNKRNKIFGVIQESFTFKVQYPNKQNEKPKTPPAYSINIYTTNFFCF